MRRLMLALVLLGGCGGDDDPCGEPRYAGKATDEAWRTMVDGEASVMTGSDQAPTFTAPADGQTVADAPIITWTSPLQRKPLALHLPHLPPVTSDIYLVDIQVPGRECPVELLTTDLEWELDASEWAAIKTAAPGDVTVSIMSAYLVENRITEGPYAPARSLTMKVQ